MSKLTLICMLLTVFQLHARSQLVTLDMKDATLKEVIWSIESQTHFVFMYSKDDLEKCGRISVNIKAENVDNILQQCLQGTGLTYVMQDDVIVLRPQQQITTPIKIKLQGVVRDKRGNPLPGVTIVLKGTTLGSMTDVNGKFMSALHLNGDFEKYQMSKYIYCDALRLDVVLYDTVSCSFYLASARQDYISNPLDGNGADMTCQNTNKRLLYLGYRALYYGTHAFAVFQDKTDPNLKIMSKIKINASGNNLTGLEIVNDTLQVGSPAFNAERYTMSHSEDVMYFVADNQLYSKNVGGTGKNGLVTSEYQIPAGEKMTFIKSLNLSSYKFNYVILGTEINGSYKIRFFGKTTAGHLNPEPVMELPRENESSDGRASDVIYIDPGLSTLSYVLSY